MPEFRAVRSVVDVSLHIYYSLITKHNDFLIYVGNSQCCRSTTTITSTGWKDTPSPRLHIFKIKANNSEKENKKYRLQDVSPSCDFKYL